MEQTDRQTDKASHWKTAVFDVEDNLAKLNATPPEFVKRIHKQQEICPTTQRTHFQIHVECNRQVRLTQLTSWIKHTKWFAVLGKDHIANSIKYCSKKDTAVPGTQEVVEGQKYLQLHELLQAIARFAEPDPYFDDVNEWKRITQRMVIDDVRWVNKLSNPALRRMWDDWGRIFVYKWEDSAAFIIEGSAPEVPGTDEGVCLIED